MVQLMPLTHYLNPEQLTLPSWCQFTWVLEKEILKRVCSPLNRIPFWFQTIWKTTFYRQAICIQETYMCS